MKLLNLVESLRENSALTLFQKILLATDGTVTDLLSLYTGHTIHARKINHTLDTGAEVRAKAVACGLQCEVNAKLLHRKIVLGSPTENLLFAESFFIFDRFSVRIQKALAETEQPIGWLWKEEKLEMYREVVDLRLETSPEISHLLGVTPETLLVSRAYLIYNQQQHLGVINETFPLTKLR
jgi:chorismate-pyruvate lyase